MVDYTVFSVQDDTGTVAQLTIAESPAPVHPIAVGDTGLYEGYPDNGTGFTPVTFQSLTFTVVSVLDNGLQFSVRAANANMADWPADGLITWQTGANVLDTSAVTSIDPANVYESVAEFKKYHASRGNTIPVGKTDSDIQKALVKARDYLDAKYKYSGVKLLQTFGTAIVDANSTFLETWLTPYAVTGYSWLTPSTTTQQTEWPRQGVVDFNGNSVNGIPAAIKAASSELGIRVLNGTDLQPDYDPNIVGAGGIVSSVTEKVGPIETSTTWDTKAGLGFFASFPVVDRMLRSAGLLSSGGGRRVIR